MPFWSLQFLPKNKWKHVAYYWKRIHSFVFLKYISSAWQFAFKINWPLQKLQYVRFAAIILFIQNFIQGPLNIALSQHERNISLIKKAKRQCSSRSKLFLQSQRRDGEIKTFSFPNGYFTRHRDLAICIEKLP